MKHPPNLSKFLFQISLQRDVLWHKMLLFSFWQQGILMAGMLLLLLSVSLFCRLSLLWPLMLLLLILLRILTAWSGLRRKMERQLLEELSDVLFHYELYLLRGENQYQALCRVTQRSVILCYRDEVQGYIEELNEIYLMTRWMVVKKMAMLFERGMSFSLQDLGMDFMDVTRELFERYHRLRRMDLERKEHRMLFPMTLNMLLMMFYIAAPFILFYL